MTSQNAIESREIFRTYGGRGYQFASTTQSSIKFREFGELLFSLSFYQITLNHVKFTDFNVFFPVVLMDFTGPNQKLKDSGRVS